MPKRATPIVEKFWSAVEKRQDGCWAWTKGKNSTGYGVLYGQLGAVLAHRFSYELHKGPIPRNLFVCHTCDNPECVNPDHLFAGTARDNVRDCMSKGRKPTPPVFYGDDHYLRRNPHLAKRGEQIGTSKLTTPAVVSLLKDRAKGHSFGKLARAYGLDKSTVQDICAGRRWRHVLGIDGAPSLAELLAVEGNRRPSAKLTEDQVSEVKARLASGETGRSIAKAFGIHFGTVSDIRCGKIWKEVRPKIRAASSP